MTRTNALRVWLITGLVTAFAATPALASDGYESANAIAGSAQSSDGDRGFGSVNAITGPVQTSDDRGLRVDQRGDRPGRRPALIAGHPRRPLQLA